MDRDKDVLFWVSIPTETEYSYDFAFQMRGVLGPDEKVHVVIGASQLTELATVVAALRESYEQREDHEEEPQIFDNEGGLIIARS